MAFASDPFDRHYFRLLQHGKNTLLQEDRGDRNIQAARRYKRFYQDAFLIEGSCYRNLRGLLSLPDAFLLYYTVPPATQHHAADNSRRYSFPQTFFCPCRSSDGARDRRALSLALGRLRY